MDEMAEYLDENNQVKGITSRSNAYQNKYKLKAAFVILTNSTGKYYIGQRSKNKKISPLKWVVGAGGCVSAGETFKEAAARELQEELGATSSIKYLLDFDYSDPFGGYYGQVFLGKWNKKITLQLEEFENGHWATTKEILDLIKTNQLAPDTKIFFEKYLKLIKK